MARKAANKPYRLIAAGRLAATTRDAMGDTLGSLSAMAIEPGSWRASGDGAKGVLVTLPDRGFNKPEENHYSNYPTRLQRIGFELKGETLSLEPLGTRYLRDEKGALTTGLDPGAGTTRQFGMKLPSPKKGPAAGRISIDSEGLAIAKDGRFFIGDEFGANVYCCARDGRMTGVIAPPDAFVPMLDGEEHFSSEDELKLDQGRGPNDGFEGLSLSPDGRELYALLQSPLSQDRSNSESNRFTRLLVHDVAEGRKPKSPKHHFVVELPLFEVEGEKKRSAAEVNDIVALGDGQILILARECFGFGAKKRNSGTPIAFKKVMIGSLAGATDLAGSKYERKAKSIMRNGELDRDIAPVKLTPFLDIADEAELNRFGLTAQAAKTKLQLLSAKWESLVLSPALDAKRPNERLLFIGNDNDFRTRHGFMPEGMYDGEFEHDNMILVFRVTLPG